MANITTSVTVDTFMQASNQADARTALGAANASTTISAGTGLTGGGDFSANRTISLSVPISIANGGTNATDATTAKANLGLANAALTDAVNTFTTQQLISLTTGSGVPALKITQLGAGDAFRVEDEPSEGTPFVINAEGHVGIGVAPATGATAPCLSVDQYGIKFSDASIQTTAFVSSNIVSFTSSGSYTKPAGAKSIEVLLIAGGGGGGGGGKNTGNASGGSGGGGGGFSRILLPAASVTSGTITVTVGSGGTGGNGATGTLTPGTIGNDGGDSSFGSYFKVKGGSGGPGGVANASGAIGNGGFPNGGAGGYGSVNAIGSSASPISLTDFANVFTCGGGQGGGVTASAGFAGGAGAFNSYGQINGGGSNSAGSNATSSTPIGGGGGGGGSGTNGAFSGSIGGTGGLYGAGGGGGGANNTATGSGTNAGKGGSGASGIVIVITYF